MANPLRLLILEDRPDDAELMLHELRQAGFEPDWGRVETEADYVAALQRAVEQDPPLDLILADYSLPQFDAVRALDRLQEYGLDIPFIIVSGTIGEDVAVQCMKQGAADYLLKDRLARLGQAVIHALEEKQLREEKRQAQKALRESEARFRALLQTAPDAIVTVDEDGRIILVNRQAEKMFGYEQEDLLDQPVEILLPERFQQRHVAHRVDYLSDPRTRLMGVELELVGRHKDGSEFPVEVSLSPLETADGLLVTSIIRDITERVRAEEAQRRLTAIIEATPDFVATADKDGRGIYLNRAGREMLGMNEDEDLSTFTIVEGHPESVRDRILNEALPIATREGSWSGETALLARDGREIPVSQVILAHKAADGSIEFFSTIARDITERVQMEERIRREGARTKALLRTAARLNAQLDLGRVLEAVCEETAGALDVPAVSVALYDEERETFYPAADFGLPPEYGERTAPAPRANYDEHTQHMGQIKVIPDLQALPDLANADLYAALDMRTAVSADMVREGQLAGSLTAFTFGDTHEFSENERALLKGLADQAAQAITNARLLDEAQRRLKQVQALREIDMAITSTLDLRVTFSVILDQVTSQLGADAAAVLLLNPHTQILEHAADRGFRSSVIERSQLRLGEGHAGRAALERRTVSTPNLAEAEEPFVRADLMEAEGLRAYHAAPLIAKGQVQGVLEIFHRAPVDAQAGPGQAFDTEWVDFLETLGGQAAIAIENAALFDDLQRSNTELALAYDTTLEGWARALELRDLETEGHSQRVTEMTVRLAREMSLDREELVHVRRGALLHDIGKMGVPDGILFKPGELSDEEWDIIRQHPVHAYDMLAPIRFLQRALDIPYCHHEKWDGTGYPRGLRGEQIPLAARIFAVVDVYDALRSDRPYRDAWSEEEARHYIREEAGRHFDPDVAERFLEMLERDAK